MDSDDDEPMEDVAPASDTVELRAAPNFADDSVRGPEEPLVFEMTDTPNGADASSSASIVPVMPCQPLIPSLSACSARGLLCSLNVPSFPV